MLSRNCQIITCQKTCNLTSPMTKSKVLSQFRVLLGKIRNISDLKTIFLTLSKNLSKMLSKASRLILALILLSKTFWRKNLASIFSLRDSSTSQRSHSSVRSRKSCLRHTKSLSKEVASWPR